MNQDIGGGQGLVGGDPGLSQGRGAGVAGLAGPFAQEGQFRFGLGLIGLGGLEALG